jgi:hypothetical protein
MCALPLACASGPDFPPELFGEVRVEQDWYRGPEVHVSHAGPARFVEPVYEAFDRDAAMSVVRYMDGFYRAPANPHYDAVLERIAQELREAGFGGEDARLQLEFLQGETVSTWTPKSAELVLDCPDTSSRTLHRFSEPGDVERTMLPINAPSCELSGDVAMSLEDLEPGMILVTDVRASQVIRRAEARGAVAVVSAYMSTYNVDPSGAERHLDAIKMRTLPVDNELPVMQISPSSYRMIERACQQMLGSPRCPRLHLRAEVVRQDRPLRTLVARIVGAKHPQEAVAMGGHVIEAGACDNASGAAGLLEGARCLAALLRSGELEWPARSVVFLWGARFVQTEHWLDQRAEIETVAGIAAEMIGESRDTGAIALLERPPDPGAIVPLPPDQHTPYGPGEVDPEALEPDGLAVVARCAMVDVGVYAGPWESAEHPWEGGSDHDIFFERGIPGVLFWHFTDFTFHTSLDRLDFVDPDELRRSAVAILATALAVADPRPSDLDRYLKTLSIEEAVRQSAAENADQEELAAQWREWCVGMREWLRNLCLDIEETIPR